MEAGHQGVQQHGPLQLRGHRRGPQQLRLRTFTHPIYVYIVYVSMSECELNSCEYVVVESKFAENFLTYALQLE